MAFSVVISAYIFNNKQLLHFKINQFRYRIIVVLMTIYYCYGEMLTGLLAPLQLDTSLSFHPTSHSLVLSSLCGNIDFA